MNYGKTLMIIAVQIGALAHACPVTLVNDTASAVTITDLTTGKGHELNVGGTVVVGNHDGHTRLTASNNSRSVTLEQTACSQGRELSINVRDLLQCTNIDDIFICTRNK